MGYIYKVFIWLLGVHRQICLFGFVVFTGKSGRVALTNSSADATLAVALLPLNVTEKQRMVGHIKEMRQLLKIIIKPSLPFQDYTHSQVIENVW